MVKIAIVGGSGSVAKEVVDALVDIEKHEIVLLSRQSPPRDGLDRDKEWIKVDYQNVPELVKALHGVHTLLSFITTQSDPGNTTQINLIKAPVQAGGTCSRVRRIDAFAGGHC